MDFNDFVKQKKVFSCTVDEQKILALVKMCQNNLLAVKKMPFTNEFANIILSSAYESLRQVLEAMTLKKGYKVYSHEAYIYYLFSLHEPVVAEKFDRLRKLRNGVHYYAKSVSLVVAKDAFEEIVILCEKLRKKYL